MTTLRKERKENNERQRAQPTNHFPKTKYEEREEEQKHKEEVDIEMLTMGASRCQKRGEKKGRGRSGERKRKPHQ